MSSFSAATCGAQSVVDIGMHSRTGTASLRRISSAAMLFGAQPELAISSRHIDPLLASHPTKCYLKSSAVGDDRDLGSQLITAHRHSPSRLGSGNMP